MNMSAIADLEQALQESYQELEERGVVLRYEVECWLIEQECRRLLGRVAPEVMS